MNCDHAFECLTDPARRESQALAIHLESCPRCRDMADTLSPALDLFDESTFASRETVVPLQSIEHVSEGHVRPATVSQPATEAAQARDAAWPNAPWHTEAQRRLKRRLVTWQILAGVAGLTCVLAAITLLRHSDQSAMIAMQTDRNCQRAESTTKTASTVVSGCVACHTLEDTLQLIAASRRSDAQATVARCVTCHLDKPRRPAPAADGLHASADETSSTTLIACQFLPIEG
ncbi:MAG: hypothetical protein ACYTGL_08815 [Planctomycetota bacterium]|jgi:hypothetical protein